MLQNILSYLDSSFKFKTQTIWFKKAVYFYILIKCLYWLYYYDVIFGSFSVVFTKPFFNLGFIHSAAYFLYSQTSYNAAYWFIIPLLSICVIGLFRLKYAVFYNALAWLILINIHNRIYPALTGGDFLLNQLMFFNIFLSTQFEDSPKRFENLRIIGHNLGSVAIIIQVCFVYLFAALAKLNDPDWMNGTAILSVAQVDHFSLPFIKSLSLSSPAIFIFLNYLVFGYQLVFPVVLFLQKYKIPFLLIGILMHLYIAFIMGLLSFGIIMIICYIYFWPQKQAN